MPNRALHSGLVNISGTDEQPPSPKIYINILHLESMIDVPKSVLCAVPKSPCANHAGGNCLFSLPAI